MVRPVTCRLYPRKQTLVGPSRPAAPSVIGPASENLHKLGSLEYLHSADRSGRVTAGDGTTGTRGPDGDTSVALCTQRARARHISGTVFRADVPADAAERAGRWTLPPNAGAMQSTRGSNEVAAPARTLLTCA